MNVVPRVNRPSMRDQWTTRIVALAVALLALWPASAEAAGLTSAERARLGRGEVVKREADLELAQGEYVGGVAYVVIQAPPEAVMAALTNVRAYRSIFPMAVGARQVGKRGHDTLIELRHAAKIGEVGYTVRVRQENRRLVRFWLDPSRPHDMDDAWGYFRVDPVGDGATLLTYAAAINLGTGLTRALFGERIREIALDTPTLVRRYVEQRPVRIAQLPR
jgi:carbon monoxide dehydrogenase subunit G